MRFFPLVAAFGLSLALSVGCTDPFENDDGGGSDASFIDGGGDQCTDPKGDNDGDGISNGDEGCVSGRDSDGDKIPDWQDFDSDDDGIYDDLEKGEKDANGKCKGAKAPKDKLALRQRRRRRTGLPGRGLGQRRAAGQGRGRQRRRPAGLLRRRVQQAAAASRRPTAC